MKNSTFAAILMFLAAAVGGLVAAALYLRRREKELDEYEQLLFSEDFKDEDDYDEEEDSRDGIAETLIRWVPPITAIVCAGIALWGFVYYQFIL